MNRPFPFPGQMSLELTESGFNFWCSFNVIFVFLVFCVSCYSGVIMAALCNRAGHYIFTLWFLSFFLLLSFFPCLISAATDWMSTILWHVVCLSANLECRSEIFCTRLAGNAGPKKIAIWAPSHKSSGYKFATKARIDNRKKLVKQQCLSHMSSQYGELQPSSGWDLLASLRHPCKFQRFRVLAALLHGI